MEKKLWENPTVTKLGVESTESGHNPTEEHDMTTYDNVGNWWAGGMS